MGFGAAASCTFKCVCASSYGQGTPLDKGAYCQHFPLRAYQSCITVPHDKNTTNTSLSTIGPSPGSCTSNKQCTWSHLNLLTLIPNPWQDPQSRSPNSGLQNSYGVDYRTFRGIYFLDLSRRLGCRSLLGFYRPMPSEKSEDSHEGTSRSRRHLQKAPEKERRPQI